MTEQRFPLTSLALLGFFVIGVLAATRAELRQLQLLGVGALVLRRGVIALPTSGAFEADDDSLCVHGSLLQNLGCHLAFTSSSGSILTTTPAPTVLPPSRIATVSYTHLTLP